MESISLTGRFRLVLGVAGSRPAHVDRSELAAARCAHGSTRSAESDFLALVVKLLLPAAPGTQLVVMSATLHAELFAAYFAPFGVADPLFVGAKRFPLTELFLEDIAERCRRSAADALHAERSKCVSLDVSPPAVDGPRAGKAVLKKWHTPGF